MCATSGIVCEGYPKPLFFEAGGGINSTTRFRRTVQTIFERESMSRSLAASIPSGLVSKWIVQLEDECQEASDSQEVSIHRGPFGVFRMVDDTPYSTPSVCEIQPALPVFPVFDLDLDCFDLSPNDQNAGVAIGIMDTLANEPSLTLGDTESLELLINNSAESTREQMPIPQAEEIIIRESTLQGLQPPLSSTEAPLESFLISLLGAESKAPADASFLLKHYSTNIINLYSPFRDAKTPWDILLIPQAKDCLASLSIGEQPNHASLCSFYAVLSISALSLSNIIESSSLMHDKAKLYQKKAHDACQDMLASAYQVPKTAKYKTILLAFVTMIQLSLITGNREQCEYYFLETEKFIRLRGLHRQKSRKVRTLHHCYAFERILWETTSTFDPNSLQRRSVCDMVENSGLVIYRQDSPTFRLPKWKDVEREVWKVRSLEEGENDLHSERPLFLFPKLSLYPEIFGVPEPFVLLISLVVRLGREKDAAELKEVSDPLNLADFFNWAKLIEKGMAELANFTSQEQSNRLSKRMVDHTQLDCMLMALRSAIAIHFHRRIYDTEAPRLQEKITDIQNALFFERHTDISCLSGSAQLIWSAFIGGCEVEDPGTRAAFTTWFEESARQSGLNFFTDTLQRLKNVWLVKSNLQGKAIGWMELMRRAETHK